MTMSLIDPATPLYQNGLKQNWFDYGEDGVQ